MGIEFFLISYDLPGRTSMLAIYSFVDSHLDSRMFRRLDYPAITRNDSISSIVARICRQLARHSLDVLRIYAHGSNETKGEYPLRGEPVHILLGEGLTSTTARAFSGLSHLWHTTSPAGAPGSYAEPATDRRTNVAANEAMRRITPRIEMHACWASVHTRRTLQALASAARAPVFAANVLQAYSRPSAGRGWRMTNWNLEGTISSFYP
jgi:hypothetical protein